jgi:hypothetical protein
VVNATCAPAPYPPNVTNAAFEFVGWARIFVALPPVVNPYALTVVQDVPPFVVRRGVPSTVHTMLPLTGLMEIQIAECVETWLHEPPPFVVR